VALDEFGHIEIIGHHVNYADESDYTDSVVQATSRSRPGRAGTRTSSGVATSPACSSSTSSRAPMGWSRPASRSVPSATLIAAGGSVRITGNLKIAVASAARSLSGDPLSGRAINLQRRALGSTTWATMAALTATGTAGSYAISFAPASTVDYRLSFSATSPEGLLGSVSSVVRITVTACTAVAAVGIGPQVACE